MHDDTTPATKADISGLRNELKADIRELREEISTSKEEILHEFRLTVETIRHDLVGANRDEITQMKDKSQDHESRIRRLERSSSLAA